MDVSLIVGREEEDDDDGGGDTEADEGVDDGSNNAEAVEVDIESMPEDVAGRGCGMVLFPSPAGFSSDRVQFLTTSTAGSPLSRVIGVILTMHASIMGPSELLLV